MEREVEPLFRDGLFRKKKRNGEWEVVASPIIYTPIADSHAHLQMLPDPPLSLARAALHKVEFVETGRLGVQGGHRDPHHRPPLLRRAHPARAAGSDCRGVPSP